MATGDKYVMNGVWLTCDKGVTPSRFNVTPKPVQLYDEHFANELDKIPLVNIMPFGVCSVTRTPCMPVPVMWERVMDDGLTVLGARPLVDTSKCRCGVGGQIAIHFTKAGATAAVELDQKLDKVDEIADAAETASQWAFFGGIALAVGGAILCATGVGAPLGAAMIAGGGELITASTVLASAAAITKGVTKFARDPSKEAGLSIVGEVLTDLAVNYVMNKLGGAVVKRLGKLAQKAMNKLGISERASKLANRILCTVTGHPVDVISGYLYTEAIDFEFPGPIPLRWERLWNSTSIHAGPLGHGWHHSYDLALVVEADQQLVAVRGADGRGLAFELPALGARSFNRLEKMSLLRDERGYGMLDHGQGLTYRFGPARPDGVQPLAAVENANGFAIAFAYDEPGYLTGIVDSAGRQFQVRCDAQGRLLSIATAHPTEPRQTVTLVAYAYNDHSELTHVTDALGQAATYQYQEQLLVQETFKNGLSFYFEYAGSGPEARCMHTWGDEGIYDHTLAYDLEAKRTVVTNSLGYATTYQGNENGLVVEMWDARGGVTLTEYSEFNDLLSQTDPLGQTTSHEYDERGNCLVTAMPDGARVQYAYNPAGHLLALTDAVGGQWQWTYDEAGNLTKQTNPTGNTEEYSYADGLLYQSVNPSKHTTTFTYDTTYNVAEMLTNDGQKSRWLYDGWGRMRKSVDARSNVQWREYDLLSRVVTVHEPDGDVRRFTYDAADNVTRTQDRHSQVQYAYRGMSRMIRRVEAGTNVEFLYDTEEQLRAVVNEHGLSYRFELDGEGDVITEAGFDGLTRRYQRDVSGRVVELELPSGQRTRYGYDPAGRVTEVQYGDGSTEAYTYRADGAMLSAANNTVAVTFARNVAGQVLEERLGKHSVSSVYDTQGNRTTLTSSLGADVHFSRNGQGEVTQMKAGVWQALFERDAQGLELHRTLSGGVHARWQRDTLGRPIEQRISIGLGQVAKRIRHYDWQAGGRISQIQDSQNGLTRFEHDALGNLAATTFSDETRELRVPDAVGNLFTTSDRRDRRYGPAGQLLEAHGTRYEYDTAGNLIRKISRNGQLWQYSWNAAGHLTEVGRPDGKVVRFDYDALGRRVRKSYKDHVTHWVWDGDKLLHEWTELEISSGADSADNLATWLFEESSYAPLAKLSHSTAHSIVVDHLGTPLQMYAANGEEVWKAELNSYGLIRSPHKSNSEECPFRYQGQYEDVETGLYYNRFRYYDPEIGQYISQDPIGMAGGDRFYGYVYDPSTWVDVLGLTKAPASLPNKPGIYILTNGRDSYVGSAGIGNQGMSQRISSTGHVKAQELLDTPGTKVQYVKVDMGSATTSSDRNNILRYYEKREYEKQAAKGFNMTNDAGIQSSRKAKHAEKLIAKHGVTASKRRTTCKP
ncbi:DUF6531 domain-containing protein [Hymenobacter negativus]|uniref:DUF4280 domain-containing protein n=1 Tax=Hymenobacter negativus TaxID=2795026 RepID=A0ABS3QNZ1_9BACT|nr:DUF6531 domain-containing protein [Hymenobacter negativus]MBO2013010.1 DUF4280 domain-containing protein [Hymenobacter negativus]